MAMMAMMAMTVTMAMMVTMATMVMMLLLNSQIGYSELIEMPMVFLMFSKTQ